MLILGENSTLVPVADFLCQNLGEGLLVHPLILSTVSQTWKCGRAATLSPDASLSSRLCYRIKSLGTPRLVHWHWLHLPVEAADTLSKDPAFDGPVDVVGILGHPRVLRYVPTGDDGLR